jgi:hypothetical protein
LNEEELDGEVADAIDELDDLGELFEGVFAVGLPAEVVDEV